MLIDLETTPAEAIPTADVIVIGAGAVGILTALELAERGFRVLILESGGTAFEARAQALNLAESIGRAHDGLLNGRARTLGGTTSLWGGQLVAFSPLDFEIRPWALSGGWPIGFGDVEPFYIRVLRRLGAEPIADTEIWRKLGFGRVPASESVSLFLTNWLREPNFKVLFRAELSRSINLNCLLHATATNLIWDDANRRVSAVEIRSWQGRSVLLKANHILVAAGTVESARLLMYAAEQNHSVPWAQNAWLGAGFHDHLDCRTASIVPRDWKRFSALFDNIYLAGQKFQPKIQLLPGKQREKKLVNIAGSIIFESSVREQIDNLKHMARTLRRGGLTERGIRLSDSRALVSILFKMIKRYLVDRRAFNLGDRGLFLNAHCEQIPCRESRLTLDPARRDNYGVPGILLDWRLDGHEIETMACFSEDVAHFMKDNGLADLTIFDDVKQRRPEALRRARDSYHQGGGLRMGRTREDGVIDANLLVFGTKNLHVAGAAAFPTSGHANSTWTAMALGLRLAANLAKHAT